MGCQAKATGLSKNQLLAKNIGKTTGKVVDFYDRV
jgi:hypothetical protein